MFMTYFYNSMLSPVGRLTLVSTQGYLVAILWENDKPLRVRLGEMQQASREPVLLETERQLNDYFSGRRQRFELPLLMQGTTFQQQVWQALQRIPFG